MTRGHLWEKKKWQLLLLYLVCFWWKMVPFSVSKQVTPLCSSKFASHVCTRLHLLSEFFFPPFLLSVSFCWSPFFSNMQSHSSDIQNHGFKYNLFQFSLFSFLISYVPFMTAIWSLSSWIMNPCPLCQKGWISICSVLISPWRNASW